MVWIYSLSVSMVVETHVPFSCVSFFWYGLGYQEVVVVEAQGHSGGIQNLAAKFSYSFIVFDINQQIVSFKINSGDGAWICSEVYASPVSAMCFGLWKYIIDLRQCVSLPWALLGDFNEILLPSKVHGGASLCHRSDI